MKKISAKLLTLITCFIITATSCQKESESFNDAMLIGTWTLSEYGVDVNSNNIVDAGELSPAETSNLAGSISFRSDKTYTAAFNYYGISDTETGTYTFTNNAITTVSNNQSTVISINSLTNNKLVVKESESSPGEWLVFTK